MLQQLSRVAMKDLATHCPSARDEQGTDGNCEQSAENCRRRPPSCTYSGTIDRAIISSPPRTPSGPANPPWDVVAATVMNIPLMSHTPSNMAEISHCREPLHNQIGNKECCWHQKRDYTHAGRVEAASNKEVDYHVRQPEADAANDGEPDSRPAGFDICGMHGDPLIHFAPAQLARTGALR